MKKNFKAILTVLFATVLAFNFMPAKANAATELNAYLAYGNNDWSVQWMGTLGTSNTEGVTGVDAVVTGVGQYTVSVDFTGSANGVAGGSVAFCAPVITGCDTTFPGYMIGIDNIQVNGQDVDFAKGYTNDESGATRMNITNIYVTSVPADAAANARSIDGDTSDSTWNVLDPSVLTDVQTMSITFTLYDQDGNGPVDADVEDTTADDAAATTTDDAAATTDVPKTGVVGLGIVYGLGALATGAAALKRKQK